MRLVIVSFAPLSPLLGAAQIVLRSAAALEARGHEAIAWAPTLEVPPVPWWRHTEWRRRDLERFLRREGPFDWIDLPPLALDRGIARLTRTVARGVQPDWLYFRADWSEPARLLGNPLRTVSSLAYALMQQRAVDRGHRLATRILCLGSLERDRLARHFKGARPAFYVMAPSAAEQRELSAIRSERRPGSPEAVRFLWIGRWAAHKGTARLVQFLDRRLRESPGDTCTIAGCGTEAERRLPQDLLQSGRIRVVPSFSRAELTPLLAGHDAGLFTSVAEGWGVTINEMLESGMPVYATRAGGVVDLAPYFPSGLRAFPPLPGPIDLAEIDDPVTTGYFDRFTWDHIAESYEHDLLGAGAGQ